MSAGRAENPLPEPPPVGRTWRTLYALILAELAVLVGLFYALTRWAA